jgi:hypothetical protein
MARFASMRDNITLALAIIGSGLGIANLIIDLWRNRVRLRVVPKLYVRSAQGSYTYDRPMDDFLKQHNFDDDPKLCVEVQNISNKPVTISLIGFARWRADKRVVLNPIFTDNRNLPRRLEPHSLFVAYSLYTPEQMWKEYGRFDFAFAETESDQFCRGSSKILKHVRKSLRKVARSKDEAVPL